ncbi:TldD/PmbA family protein [Neoehrlichia mikurensis]|uniref:TldD/PmbA family protein n=1 Tax=Neoehrlichia mikurensis TaxID=89586 RepID=A0A9Q9C0E4_9RICK|nr:TldD/PmbA family protein [Neoehrlichia mikurensis]QXK91957.1 TldD/PmbA family protein [Neoehrlichia mikurensis]QXK93170.1 TldD/PmbA family protein [Neoehrlichia mikurensis]QXK93649.1 TldD/PmbA family protein [Neoehrlichia mikurensis]UTO55394.1 TldD/PmbA family protein [Neoehrlichia mikurensis]UTO56313.1 TldD/PmbA family protein [Neoehrlichia mikurensis]
MNNYLNIAEDTIKIIKNKGVEGDVIIYDSNSLNISQRMLKLEEISYSNSVQIGIRVIDKKKVSCISSNDLSKISELIDMAITMANAAPEDSNILIPPSDNYNEFITEDLMLFDNIDISVEQISTLLQDMEGAALSYDNKIVNSEGASCSRVNTNIILATSGGFIRSYKKSYTSAYLSIIAAENNKMEVDYSYLIKCHFNDIQDPCNLGRESAIRALRKLNARKIKTCILPVVIENRVASTLLQNFACAITGDSIANKTSFLSNSLHTQVFSRDINIIDDPLIKKGIASYPFDGEGIRGYKKEIVKNGVITSWILDIYTANQLNLVTTGNAIKRSNAAVVPGVSNFYIQNGSISVNDLISDINQGIYVTDLFGFGINLTTGDYSQGAFGFMIEDGKITYPVNEITIAGNLIDMFKNISIANDLVFLKSVNSPTLKIHQMTVAGR